jgi:hypothetical protein
LAAGSTPRARFFKLSQLETRICDLPHKSNTFRGSRPAGGSLHGKNGIIVYKTFLITLLSVHLGLGADLTKACSTGQHLSGSIRRSARPQLGIIAKFWLIFIAEQGPRRSPIWFKRYQT